MTTLLTKPLKKTRKKELSLKTHIFLKNYRALTIQSISLDRKAVNRLISTFTADLISDALKPIEEVENSF